MRSRRQFLIVAAAFGGTLALPAAAGGPGGGALEITQLANLAELSAQTVDIAEGVGQRVEMITNQIQQIQVALQSYQNMVANTLSLPAQVWSPVAGSLQQLHEAVGQGQALAYTIANVDDVIRQEFSQYGDYLENPLSLEQYGERYRNWSRRNLETTSATMASVGLNIARIGSEEQVMAVLRGQNTNSGRTQLLQVGNQVAIEQVAQFQKLRQIVASNTQMMGAYFSKSEAIRDAQNASTDLYYNTPSTVSIGDEQGF